MKTISFVIPCYASEGSVALVMEEIRQTVAEKQIMCCPSSGRRRKLTPR